MGRTPLPQQRSIDLAFPRGLARNGGEELDTDAVLQLLDHERREDLPGRPLAWQVAIENLVAQLLGEPSRLIK
jgi:hypothetical protein